jgi:hypothetical protein
MQVRYSGVSHANEATDNEGLQVFTVLTDIHVPFSVITPDTSGEEIFNAVFAALSTGSCVVNCFGFPATEPAATATLLDSLNPEGTRGTRQDYLPFSF